MGSWRSCWRCICSTGCLVSDVGADRSSNAVHEVYGGVSGEDYCMCCAPFTEHQLCNAARGHFTISIPFLSTKPICCARMWVVDLARFLSARMMVRTMGAQSMQKSSFLRGAVHK